MSLQKIREYCGLPEDDTFLDNLSPQLKVDPNATGGAPFASVGSRSLAGNPDGFTTPYTDDLRWSGKDAWAAIWFKGAQQNSRLIDDDQDQVIISYGSGNLNIYFRDAVNALIGPAQATGFDQGGTTWHLCVIYRKSGGEFGISRDSESFGTFAGDATISENGSTFYLGDIGFYWIGSIGLYLRGNCDLTTNTPESIRDLVYNGGIGLRPGQLTDAQKTQYGIVLETYGNEISGDRISLTGPNLTANGSPGADSGPDSSIMADESDNANHGTITGFTNSSDIISQDVPSALAGSLDYSMEFIQSNTESVRTTAGSADVQTPFSISFWINPTDAIGGTQFPVGIGNALLFGIYGTGSNFSFQINESGGFGSPDFNAQMSGAPTVGQWTHIVGTWDGSNVIIYADAVKTVGDAATNGPLDSGFVLTIGSGDNAQYGDWKIADVRLYDSPLSDDNVTYLYTAGASGTAPTSDPVLKIAGSNSSFPVGTAADGQPVALVPDLTSTGSALYQATGANKPALLANDVNNLNVIDFDGATTVMNAIEAFDSLWFILVCSTNVDSTSDVIFADISNTLPQFRGQSAGTIRHVGNSIDPNDYTYDDGKLFIDGTSDGFTYPTDQYTCMIVDRGTSNAHPFTANDFEFGADVSLGRYADHLKVAYMIHFNRHPTKSEKANALAYCRKRFGL